MVLNGLIKNFMTISIIQRVLMRFQTLRDYTNYLEEVLGN